MTRLFMVLMVVSAFAASAMGQVSKPEQSRYMGGPVELATAENGAIVNAKLIEAYPKCWYTKPMVKEIVDGVWVVGGYSIANTIVIEGDDGLIVYDVGDTKEEAKHIYDAIREKISKKPVKVIMYSHSHYALGGGVFVSPTS